MIVVTGATGKLGRIVVEDLLTKLPADQVAVVARTPERAEDLAERGVEVRQGAYDDPASLETAFAGADKLLFVSSPDVAPGVRPRQHGQVVDAARTAGVGHIVYTSAIGADDGALFLADHTITEAAIRSSGLTYTLLRNTFYTEEFVNSGLAAAVEAGELTAPALAHPLVTATRADLALAASAVLVGDGHDDAVYELRGPGWTFPELAEALASVAGRPVTFREVADDASPLAFIVPLLRRREFGQPTTDLEKLLGRPATGVEPALRAALGG